MTNISRNDAVNAWLKLCALVFEDRADDGQLFISTFEPEEINAIFTTGTTVTNSFAATLAQSQGIAFKDIPEWLRSMQYTTTDEEK
ncbi:hypothetical protein L5I01_29710 [Gordonia sp. HY442]|uniref:hypothetical protein n=1 Tax=Gordonia zhenghanii TaxID=2911516 RepID=UPI001F38E555|nr:hypothetical protein [Gordonia zhenghanii]MCF8607541.1 hypothetical protein [Gordonia zhenghanii]